MHLLSELAGDISFALDHIAKAERIDFLAYYDVLTGLANRTLFHERLLQFVDAATRGNSRFAVVVADLERLDLVGDSYGRHVGDRLLKQAAVRFVQSVGNPNETARIGATQFAAVIPDARHESEILRTVERWWQNWFNAPFAVEDVELRIVARAGIAIDDFGTGYSSLGYLAKLPVDTLKIDRSFIATMVDAPDAMALVSTIISLAHSMRLSVVAEGVGSEEQAKILRLLKCDQMQGYLIDRPMTFDAMTTRLAPCEG